MGGDCVILYSVKIVSSEFMKKYIHVARVLKVQWLTLSVGSSSSEHLLSPACADQGGL